MNNQEIIIVGFVFATIAIVILKIIQNIIFQKRFIRYEKRVHYLQNLVKEDKIPVKIINVFEEPTRIAPSDDNKGLLIDGERYDNKNSIIRKKDNTDDTLYVVGKKEDFVIILVKN